MIIDPYSGAAYIGYYGHLTTKALEEGREAARNERLRLREIVERKKVFFERESRKTKASDEEKGKLVDITLEGNVGNKDEEKGKSIDTFS
jgi:hypothetical protein